MVAIAVNNQTLTFNTVASIIKGLAGKGNRRLAAIMAAERHLYPEDHLEEREDIIQTIFCIGQETNDKAVWSAAVVTLWTLAPMLSAELQKDPPKSRAAIVILSEIEVREAQRSYPYSELT